MSKKRKVTMKRIWKMSAIAVLVVASGCVMRVGPPVVAVQAPPPAVVVQPPPPPAVVEAPGVAVTLAPESYVWDGYEYVGLCGGQYVYWGGGGWVVCDGVILGRFHGWERYHPGWRGHATPYHRRR